MPCRAVSDRPDHPGDLRRPSGAVPRWAGLVVEQAASRFVQAPRKSLRAISRPRRCA